MEPGSNSSESEDENNEKNLLDPQEVVGQAQIEKIQLLVNLTHVEDSKNTGKGK